MEVCGLGTVAMDVLIQVDALPGKDGFCMVKNQTYQPGGSGTNVIVQLARLGASCGYIASVSADQYGADIIKSLERERVDISCMDIKENGVTLHTQIVIDSCGDKFIMLNMGDAFGKLKLTGQRLEFIRNAEVFYTDLCPGKQAAEALAAAYSSGKKTVFNMQVGLDTMNGLGVTRDDILKCIRQTDIFAPCRQGLFELTGTDDLDQCSRFLRKYTDAVLLFTLGNQGSAAYDRDGACYQVPCMKIPAIDTTGAGDSYIGGFIYAYYIQKRDLEPAMEFATACAAYTCSGLGARHCPTLLQAEDMKVKR